jgi:hypothetical protein
VFQNRVLRRIFEPEGAHTRTTLTRESASESSTREPGSDILVFHHTRMSGFRLVTLHTRTSVTHWNPSPAGLASQTRTCMGTLTLSQLMLHICRVSKTFGEWYQKTHKTEDTNKLTLLFFKIIAILHNYTVGNVHKASGNCQQRPL